MPDQYHSILSLFCVSLSGYHAEGYHAPYLPPRAITPVYTSRLPHQSYHASPYLVHRVITPAISNSYFCSFHFTGFYSTSSSPPTPPPGATRYNLLHTLAGSIERVGSALLSADEKNNNWTHLLRTPRRKSRPQLRGMQRHISRVRPILHHPRVPADPGTRAIRDWTRRTRPQEQPASSFVRARPGPRRGLRGVAAG